MNFKWHTRIALFVVISCALILEFTGKYSVLDMCLFTIAGYFNTVYASPDIDHKNSRPTKSMGAIGWATSRTFKHRGLLHNPYAWTILYILIGSAVQLRYNYSAWWLLGGLIAIYTHIVLDLVSTKVKRTKTKVRRKLHL